MTPCGGRFSTVEQAWMQVSFHGMWIVGTYAMAIQSLWLGVAYFLFVAWGIVGLIMRKLVCPRCPHLLVHGSCCQAHPALTRRIVDRRVTGELGLAGKVMFFVALYGCAIIPMYWVFQEGVLIAPFLVVVTAHFGAYFMHLCKNCLNTACPQNMRKTVLAE